MKKCPVFLSILLCLCLLAGCGGMVGVTFLSPAGGSADSEPAPGGTPSDEPQHTDETTQPAEEEAPSSATITCCIVDGAEDGSLLLANLAENGGVYRLGLSDEIPVYLDGEPAAASDLEDGMPIDVAFDGSVMETFPARLSGVERVDAFSRGTSRNPGGTYYDLCGLYLKVLDDLWQADPALNEGKPVAGLDLSQVPGGLTDSEKEAIAWRFGEVRGVEVLTATFEELVEQGHISAEQIDAEPDAAGPAFYHWEDGCHFSITPHETEEKEVYMGLPVLRFDAEKYAFSLGAYFFYDCSAVWPQMGSWSDYTVGSQMIS